MNFSETLPVTNHTVCWHVSAVTDFYWGVTMCHNGTVKHSKYWSELKYDSRRDLTFKGPCIANVFPSITKKMQCYTIRSILQNALQVSGGSLANHQGFKLYIEHRVFVKLLLLPFAIVEELDLIWVCTLKPVPAIPR
jgi:hypothetical protein